MNLVLFEPDIPQNTGTILRLGACLNMKIHIIEPCGFVFSEKNLRRYGLDYIEHVAYMLHPSWDDFLSFLSEQPKSRLTLFTTKTTKPYWEVKFTEDDYLLFGKESAGVPDKVHERCDERVTIPMQEKMRSLNLAVSVAMAAGEMLRQQGIDS